MKKMIKPIFILFVILTTIIIVNSGCKKTQFLTSGDNFSFNVDTLSFDTVFTTIGSATKQILIKNQNNKWITMSNIRLAKGDNSMFRMNVDGTPTKNINNIDIAPYDSLWVFVAVTVNPTAVDAPFIITDSIQATLNGTTKNLPLMAYGQNAIYLKDSVLQGANTWTKNKPYVIINSAMVDSTASLSIEKGTRIYMHANSTLLVKGTLQCNGTLSDSIVFQGDRLDRDYFGSDFPGEWGGIRYLSKSHDNVLSYCIIKNGGLPVYTNGALLSLDPADVLSATPTLTMNNCSVGLSLGYGILSFANSVTATNCNIYTCGAQNIALLQGGTYNFNYCTIGNYGFGAKLNHTKYNLATISNYLIPNPDTPSVYVGSVLQSTFTNCILDGNVIDGNELVLSKKTDWSYNVTLNNCIIKAKDDLTVNATLNTATTALLNKNTDFKDATKLDFTLLNTSSAKGSALPNSTTIDLKNNTRSATAPSIGCYE